MVSVLAVDLTAQAAARALGWVDGLGDGGGASDEVVWPAAMVAWGLIEGHVRGRGCPVDLVPASDPPTEAELAAVRAAATPSADLLSVAVAATLRLAPNPAQHRIEAASSNGDSRNVQGSFEGFTLAELTVLNRYRRRVR